MMNITNPYVEITSIIIYYCQNKKTYNKPNTLFSRTLLYLYLNIAMDIALYLVQI